MHLKKPTVREYVVSALLLALAITAVFAYRGFGSWLIVSDPLPEHIDVIFTFGGETVRDDYSRELAQKHPEATWIVSTFDTTQRSRIQGNAVAQSRLVVVDTCPDTWSEVRFLRSWLAERADSPATVSVDSTDSGARSGDSAAAADSGMPELLRPRVPTVDTPLTVVLVSAPYHMRRIKVAVTRQLNDKRYEICYRPTPHDRYSFDVATYEHWWRDKALARLVSLELWKIGYYMLRL